jgi:PPOX class probable F420-dependent enzyme
LSASPRAIGPSFIRRTAVIDEPVRNLLDGQNFSTTCTFASDGSVQALPTWVDTDGEYVLLNSVAGHTWVRNVERDPRVTCNVMNLSNPYEFVEVRGRAQSPTTDGATEHIHRLARKYLGIDEYPWLSPDAPRVLIRVTPERIVHMYPGDAALE